MLREIIESLRAALPLEEQCEYMNIGVEGGTDRHFVQLSGRALAAIEDGEEEAPVNCEFPLQRLHDIWKLYAREEAETRRTIVVRSELLLDKLEDTLDNAPLYETNPAQPILAPIKVEASPVSAQPESDNPLDDPVMYLKGIGPTKAKVLGKLGITTVGDLLLHFPARYEDRRLVRTLADIETGEKDSFLAEVLYEPQTKKMGAGNRSITKVRVGDGSAQIDLQWWNQAWRERQFKVGQKLFVYGKVSEFNGYRQMDAPEFEFIGDEDGSQVGRIVPVYPLTEGVWQSNLRKATEDALDKSAGRIPDPIPAELREAFGLMPLEEALRAIHAPRDWDEKEAARYRLVFEELFLLQVALAQKKRAAHLEDAGIRHIVPDEEIKKFLAALPFKLTGAQKRVMNEIRKDLKGARPMNRLLHGDVGSGKTVVAAYALWSAFKAGFQGALLAPTEILSEQHFYVLRKILEPLGVEVGLLEGSLKAKNKRQILADLAEGRIHVVVGTHALIQEGVEFQKLGVCVVDEQHRFGVMQRAALARKGAGGLRPDVLVMTATPIPRTMALTIYGDLDVSVLDELPPGRQPIKTVKIKPEARERAYNYVRAEVAKGRQAYVVCPLVEESEKLVNLQAATALAERLREGELKGLRVGLVHGQLDVIERDEQMELFRAQMFDVLVSTTVIEVGVDVPNSNAHAHRRCRPLRFEPASPAARPRRARPTQVHVHPAVEPQIG